MVMPDSWSFSQPLGFMWSQGDICTVSKTELHVTPTSYCPIDHTLIYKAMGDIIGHWNALSKPQTPVSVLAQERVAGLKGTGENSTGMLSLCPFHNSCAQ